MIRVYFLNKRIIKIKRLTKVCRLLLASYAYIMLAKDLVSEILTKKVTSGFLSKKIALTVAEKIMGEKAIEVFNL